jgi:hypothetical protein
MPINHHLIAAFCFAFSSISSSWAKTGEWNQSSSYEGATAWIENKAGVRMTLTCSAAMNDNMELANPVSMVISNAPGVAPNYPAEMKIGQKTFKVSVNATQSGFDVSNVRGSNTGLSDEAFEAMQRAKSVTLDGFSFLKLPPAARVMSGPKFAAGVEQFYVNCLGI